MSRGGRRRRRPPTSTADARARVAELEQRVVVMPRASIAAIELELRVREQHALVGCVRQGHFEPGGIFAAPSGTTS